MPTSATKPKSCTDEDCPKVFERDPALEVTCPSCAAEPGELCRRPSGHAVWNLDWPGLPKGIHPNRDAEALRQGVYGRCPLDRCPESVRDLSSDNPFYPNSDGDRQQHQHTLDEYGKRELSR